MDADANPSTAGQWTARAALFAFGCALLLPGLGATRVLTYHEVCFAQPAREMLASGRWLVPQIAGVVFPDKPPLGHWAAAGGIQLLGGNEFAVRLPFALAGVLLACVVAELGLAVWGTSAGIVAGLIQLTSYYTFLQARLAECDVLLALAVAIALTTFCFVEVLGRPFTWRHAVVLHAATGAAFLAKGPIGLIMIGGPIAAWLIVERHWKACVRWLHPAGLLVSLTAVVGWPLAAVWERPEIIEGWKRHNLDRFSGALEGEPTTPFYYLWVVPLLLMPWTPAIVAGWWQARRDARLNVARLRRFSVCWVVPGFILISAASWRHKHYAIPLLPPLSLWGAVGLLAWVRPSSEFGVRSSVRSSRGSLSAVSDPPEELRTPNSQRRSFAHLVSKTARQPGRNERLFAPVGVGLALLALVGLGISLRSANGEVFWPVLVGGPLAMMVAEELRRRGRPRLTLTVIFLILAASAQWSIQIVLPRYDSYVEQTRFAARISALTGSDPIYVPHITTGPNVPLALPENQIAYYLPLTLHVLPKARADMVNVQWVLAPARMQEALRGFAIVDQIDRLRETMTPGDRLTLFRAMSQIADRPAPGFEAVR